MTNRQQKALAALIRSPTVEVAAQEAGVGYSTLRRWIKEDANFRQAYQEELAGLISEAAGQARQSLAPALSALREITENPSSPGAVRVSAAKAILDAAMRLAEATDVLERVEALEKSSLIE